MDFITSNFFTNIFDNFEYIPDYFTLRKLYLENKKTLDNKYKIHRIEIGIDNYNNIYKYDLKILDNKSLLTRIINDKIEKYPVNLTLDQYEQFELLFTKNKIVDDENEWVNIN